MEPVSLVCLLKDDVMSGGVLADNDCGQSVISSIATGANEPKLFEE
jgi:hypothetical protein